MSKPQRLPSEVNRILFVRNLPYKITSEEIYDIFGKFGAIRQVRIGTASNTKGTAFVVMEDIYDAKMARDKLSGFNVCGRYLNILYFQPKRGKSIDIEAKRMELEALRKQHNIIKKE